MSIRDIFTMSWRKLRLLIDDDFQRGEGDGSLPVAETDFNAVMDQALGKEPPQSRTKMSVAEWQARGS